MTASEVDRSTEMFNPLGVASFRNFEWNLWSCELCGAVVEWDDLDIHEESHDPHRHDMPRSTLAMFALSFGFAGLALLL